MLGHASFVCFIAHTFRLFSLFIFCILFIKFINKLNTFKVLQQNFVILQCSVHVSRCIFQYFNVNVSEFIYKLYPKPNKKRRKKKTQRNHAFKIRMSFNLFCLPFSQQIILTQLTFVRLSKSTWYQCQTIDIHFCFYFHLFFCFTLLPFITSEWNSVGWSVTHSHTHTQVQEDHL